MAIGSLVTVPELQAEGLARLTAVRGGFSVIRFLASGAEMTQDERQVVRFCLLPGTRVEVQVAGSAQRGAITDRRVLRDPASGLLVYGLRTDTGQDLGIREDAITALLPVEDAVEQLTTVQFNDLRPPVLRGSVRPRSDQVAEPWASQAAAAREELLGWRDAAWSNTGGVIGLATARVRPLPHQLLVARRALEDRQVRFLLADEVGLGKTIEAGLIIQSLLAIKPDLRVLVIVPGALLSQWFLELFVRFGGRTWLMLDGERLAKHPGNPWSSEPFVLASARAVEDLDGKGALRLATSKWDVVVVDECHRMQPGGLLFQRVAVLSKATPHVLLLSATPARQHADAYLALLSLLQPQVWKPADLPAFRSRLAAHDAVTALLARTVAATDADLPGLATAWRDLLPADTVLAARSEAMAADPAARATLLAHVREHHQLDRRLIRNRRQVLMRLAERSGSSDFPPTTRSRERVAYRADAAETALRTAHAAYRAALVAAAGGEVPPRLAHWLVQVELAVAAHPAVLDRMLAMRATVLESPEDFTDYRKRARAGETRAQVLRSDLSENEVSSHVAISAACHADLAGEVAALDTLRSACATWLRASSAKGTARLKALIARLTAFWGDGPREKVLVFTTHALAIAPIAAALGKAFGESAVETFGAHQDTIEREEAARRFQTDDRCPLLVCDPLGGEGRNFQFVSVVAHHDLPWSLAAVEQRIGRVDRIGRDGDIPSWILSVDDPAAADTAWSEVLDEAVGVFTASSSGLEFISDTVEGQALDAALAGGGSAMRAALPAIAAVVARERDARDRHEDDGFHAGAEAYADAGRASAAVAATAAPAGAVARWIRGMGGEARRDEDGVRPWKLRTRFSDEPVVGVFDRDAALSNPGMAFFGIGNHLVDRLVADAAAARWARACAWRRPKGDGGTAWKGVRTTIVLVPDYAPIAAAGLRLEVLRRLFLAVAPVRELVCASETDGAIVVDPALRTLLAPPFSAKQGDRAVSATSNRDAWTKLLIAGESAKVTAWQQGVRIAADGVRAHAAAALAGAKARMRAALDARLDPGLEAARSVAAAIAQRLGEDHPESRQAANELAEEQRQVSALRAAVDGATFDIEGIAYVMVA
jgi:ATP-dependent helicase HepA